MLSFRYWLGGPEFEQIRAAREFKDAGLIRFSDSPDRHMRYSIDDVSGEAFVKSATASPDERFMALVSRVTAHEQFAARMRRVQGEYEWEGATAELHYEEADEMFEPGKYFVNYSAPTAEKIMVLHKKIRRGVIEPTVSHEGDQKDKRIAELEALLEDDSDECAEMERRNLDLEKKVMSLETTIELQQMDIGTLINNIWCDMRRMKWWRSRRYLQYVVEGDLIASGALKKFARLDVQEQMTQAADKRLRRCR